MERIHKWLIVICDGWWIVYNNLQAPCCDSQWFVSNSLWFMMIYKWFTMIHGVILNNLWGMYGDLPTVWYDLRVIHGDLWWFWVSAMICSHCADLWITYEPLQSPRNHMWTCRVSPSLSENVIFIIIYNNLCVIHNELHINASSFSPR